MEHKEIGIYMDAGETTKKYGNTYTTKDGTQLSKISDFVRNCQL